MGKINLFILVCLLVAGVMAAGCERLDNDIRIHGEGDPPFIALEDVAALLTEISIGEEQLREVFDAVSSSSENGYDEEYTMRDLFRTPGAGVGDSMLKGGSKSVAGYSRPLKDIIGEHLRESTSLLSKSSPSVSAEEYIAALESSDIQIYWPFSENWDGESFPVITFDPADGSDTNIGYVLAEDAAGGMSLKEVVVDEAMAMERPVWVVNRNEDAGYASLEMLRRQDPEWGSGGGSVIIRPKQLVRPVSYGRDSACPVSLEYMGAAQSGLRTLVLKDLTMLRHYDSWFAGASEFFVKIGAVEDFTASTEAELRLYSPSVTDFMIVVKRRYLGEPRPFNAVLVSDWTDQLEQCALMIIEDDGGTRTSWKCTAVVKVASKSYGIEISLPFNTRDDIVWRGQLSRRYLETYDGKTGHFGDVDLTFELQ